MTDVQYKEKEKLYNEDEIDRRIKRKFPRRSKLSYSERRELVIQEMNKEYDYQYENYLDFQNNTLIIINIKSIRDGKEKFLNKEVKKRKTLSEYTKLSDSDIRDIILGEMNDSEYYEITDFPELPKNSIVSTKRNQDSIFSTNVSSESTAPTDESTQVSSQHDHVTVNEKRMINCKLYDINYVPKSEKNPEYIFKYENYFAYKYQNDNKTYSFTQSKYFSKDENLSIKEKSKNYNELYGLCFCGKEIKEYNLICAPDQIMCKECMEETNRLYNLGKDCLINIHGRVCKKLDDNRYYCIGKFIDKKYKRTLICMNNKFMCNSCKFINDNINYYS